MAKLNLINKYQRIFLTFIFTFSLICTNFNLFSQDFTIKRNIIWSEKKYFHPTNGEILFQSFDKAIIKDPLNPIPTYHETFSLNKNCSAALQIIETEYQTVNKNPENYPIIENPNPLSYWISFQNDKSFLDIEIVPYRINPENGQTERLVSFSLIIKEFEIPITRNTTYRAATHSVLSTGEWYKIKVSESGIYKIDYSFLEDMGINPKTINPKNIRVFGNGGKMLPMPNSTPRPDDLVENAIFVSGEADNSFDDEDYLLLYAEGPHTWRFDKKTSQFYHIFNYYSDFAYYFIVIDNVPGKRIKSRASLGGNPDFVSSDYVYTAFHEKVSKTEVTEYVKSGRDWFGEEFDFVTSQKINFSIPNINTNYPVKFRSYVAGRSAFTNFFNIDIDGNSFSHSLYEVQTSDYLAQYCSVSVKNFNFMPSSGNLEFTYSYLKPDNASVGWLNYISINASARLLINKGQLQFIDTGAFNKSLCQYTINSTLPELHVWDVTHLNDPVIQQTEKQGNNFVFKFSSDSLSQFVAFQTGTGKIPSFVEKLQNQDLHALEDVQMIIVTYPDFIETAKKLADFRKKNDSLNVAIVTPAQIYNEFSSGAQDITAIRDFVKFIYDKQNSSGKELKYLLLLGDASYDYRNVLTGNTNYVPTYQSPTVYSPISSYASDDYYGFLDANEGNWDDINQTRYHKMDISIGRFPVSKKQEAEDIVNKIIHYSSSSAMGDWRNNILFVSDDVDDGGFNAHIEHSEFLAKYLDQNEPNLNIHKIYMDAYRQISSSNGHKYPAAQESINNKVNTGMLVVNYIGHGGEVGWAHERVLEIADIKSWTNFDKLAVFVTATCEFSRYDDPGRVSAGELVLLNPDGGAAALLTTSRVVYVSANETLTTNLYEDNFFERINGHHKSIGEVIMKTKNLTGSDENARKFILLGDPSMKLAYPDNTVVTTEFPDTLKAFSLVTIKGEVRDQNGVKLSNFNGTVCPAIYDKPSKLITLDNDNNNKKVPFDLRNNIIYKGKASVINGDFSFSFIVPKDISYAEGFGKISYYASNGKIDASGYYEDIIVGGTSDSIKEDNVGPVIRLFMGDTNFVNGGMTDENPLLIAKVWDKNGINTVGNGIGHELIAVLDVGEPIILNDYYQSTLNDYRSGTLMYQLKNLSEGEHTIWLKVWDIANNSSEATVRFIVTNSENLTIKNLFCYPNPSNGLTTFSFEHNKSGEDLQIRLDIFSKYGSLVKSIEEDINSQGNRINDIQWNPQELSLESGIYIVRLTLTASDGQLSQMTTKLIYIK